MDLTFLDKIEIEEEQKGKEETVKSIRFSKDEYYMLKYCKFLNKKFSTFIKELINESIIELKNERIVEKDLDGIKEQLKNEIKQELLKELSVNNEDEIDNKKLEAQKDIFNFMNNKK